MKIAGIQKNSFVDYPGRIAAVVFTYGCNLDCWYCHNREILRGCKEEDLYDSEMVLKFLNKRKGFLDGVVISGGEPTSQKDLKDYIAKIKDMGYCVKLDTNGTRPRVIRKLINEKLVDYVAMDIKGSAKKYDEICGVHVDMKDIQTSIDILMEGEVDYEFRTTLAPELDEDDIKEIAQRIKGARSYVIQQFRKPEIKEGVVDYRALKSPHSPSYVRELSQKVGATQTRGII